MVTTLHVSTCFSSNHITDADSDADVKEIDDEDGLVVLIRPKKPAAQRIKRRFHTLQENRRKTSQLMGFIRDSDDEGL
jgi:myosin heavy subunit